MSTNLGASWTPINTGLTEFFIRSLTFDGTNIYAGTFGGSVWRRPLSDIIGIKEITLNNNIFIYPNPTSKNLTIETNSNTKQNVEIVNLLGQIIYTYNIYSKATIDVVPFPERSLSY